MTDNSCLAHSVNLSLISHTNVGKTTLTRTLLRRDVGEVREGLHVTDVSEAYVWIQTQDGSRLTLWDTPGFGDTARLLQRLKMSGNPLGWVLTQVWDRFKDRPFWCSQQAIRNVKQDADIVLYIVNTTEGYTPYVGMELEIIGWMEKPVILLLNQLGQPLPSIEEAAEAEKWRLHLQGYGWVKKVLSLDAFTRCWVQETILLQAVAELLPRNKQEIFRHLSDEWISKNIEVFHQSMSVISAQLAKAACDEEVLEKKSWGEKALGWLRKAFHPDSASDEDRAMAALAERLDNNIRQATNRLIELNGLKGQSTEEVLKRLEKDYSLTKPISVWNATWIGGLVSGALSGLAADMVAGGLTFGGGAVAGGILGALGTGLIAEGYNRVQGQTQESLRWSADFCLGLVRASLLRYLVVAHFGRGRGEYVESERPKFWQDTVDAIIKNASRPFLEIFESAKKTDTDQVALCQQIKKLLQDCADQLLEKLYPGVSPALKRKPNVAYHTTA